MVSLFGFTSSTFAVSHESVYSNLKFFPETLLNLTELLDPITET